MGNNEKNNNNNNNNNSKASNKNKKDHDKSSSEKKASNDVSLSQGSEKEEEDKFKKFEGEGVLIKAKLIGSELVIEPRGDKICQDSIQRLKAIIRGQRAHKRRILLKISYDGVKVLDEKSNELLYHNEVPQISFIASDSSDARTFGYICDVPNKAHRFICFKTLGPAVQVMSVISCLFEAVLEQKTKQQQPATSIEQQNSNILSDNIINRDRNKDEPVIKQPQQQNEQALIIDANEVSDQDDNGEKNVLGHFEAPTALIIESTPTANVIDAGDDGDYLEFGYGSVQDHHPIPAPAANLRSTTNIGGSVSSGAKSSIFDLVNEQLGDLFIGGPPPTAPSINNNNNNNRTSSSQGQLATTNRPVVLSGSALQQQPPTLLSTLSSSTSRPFLSRHDSQDIFSWDQQAQDQFFSNSQTSSNRLQRQSTLKSDALASESFSGGGGTVLPGQLSIASDSGILDSSSSGLLGTSFVGLGSAPCQPPQQHQHTPPQWPGTSPDNGGGFSSPPSQQQQLPPRLTHHPQSRPINLVAPRPVPARQSQARNSSHNSHHHQALSASVKPSSNFMMPSAPKDDPFSVNNYTQSARDQQNPNQQHHNHPFGHNNRSLIYNHSSASLNEASLTRQSSFGVLNSNSNNKHSAGSGTDKYAVFNDIDNLPSIFESTSSLNGSDSVAKLNATWSQSAISRQTNPFDDDFFENAAN